MVAAKHIIIDTKIIMTTNYIIAITFHVVDRLLKYLRKFIATAIRYSLVAFPRCIVLSTFNAIILFMFVHACSFRVYIVMLVPAYVFYRYYISNGVEQNAPGPISMPWLWSNIFINSTSKVNANNTKHPGKVSLRIRYPTPIPENLTKWNRKIRCWPVPT